MNKSKILHVSVALLALTSSVSFAASTKDLSPENPTGGDKYSSAADASQKGSLFGGPSLHLAGGFRVRKAPDLDQFYTGYGGIKATLFSIATGEQAYVSLLGAGIYLQKEALLAFSFTPVILNLKYGIGLAVDFFPVSDRVDRPAGPWGISVNLDIMRIMSMLGKF